MKAFIITLIIFLFSGAKVYADMPDPGGDLLPLYDRYMTERQSCGSFQDALASTRQRLSTTGFEVPDEGRVILVNIPGQMLHSYDDGELVLESRVVVGSSGWATPELDTEITFVRLNPDWTVPQSIINARGWRQKVLSDPGYFSQRSFAVISSDGRSHSPQEAAARGIHVAGLIQRPGPGNALGMVKFGLRNAGAIFLHHTNAPHLFEEANRARSAGCVRVEKALELAAWILGKEDGEVESLLAANDRKNRTALPHPVRVVLGYWTAWPDPEGAIRFYPDIYRKDASAGKQCPWNTERRPLDLLEPPPRPLAARIQQAAEAH